ncbi:MAG TPA: nucleotide sugar dehydratase [Rhodospirillaceae bacterium]|nr:nucleotide sugar dehydratase [Rhodospirillaceae bacterium]
MKRFVYTFLQPRNLLVYGHDVTMAYLAFVGAFFLRLGPGLLNERPEVLYMAVVFSTVAAILYLVTGLYRHVWEYVSAKDAINILRTATMIVLFFMPAWFLVTRLENLPRSTPFISWLLLVMLLAGPRLVVRMARDRQVRGFLRNEGQGTPILLIGAGPEAELFIRATTRHPGVGYDVVGMVTAREDRIGQVIQDVEVLGREVDLVQIIAGLEGAGQKPEKLVLVRTGLDGSTVQRLFTIAEKAGCQLMRVPPPADMRAYDDEDVKPRPIAIEDLLGRSQAQLDRKAMAEMIRQRRILITGAGGSIGSELVRQVSDFEPSHLTLFDHSEFSLYGIDMEMRRRRPSLVITSRLGNVRDEARVQDVIVQDRPDVVFHAAALKHVPMVELNPVEGVLTNAVGTRNVADACAANGVSTMVLISTDKAVNPANIMGASKRVAEIYCQAEDLRRSGTRFITVRFGNVLGSAGSVVPLFQKQLEDGGPLEVTHPEVERYFMTAREAVELVLEAAALGKERSDEGAIYVLDMGAPVRIMDLAKQMIRLAGKTLGENMDIEITGLRPGDKLSEELFQDSEPPVATDMAGILLARPRTVNYGIIASKLAALDRACRSCDEPAVLSLVADLVPEFSPSGPSEDRSYLQVVK